MAIKKITKETKELCKNLKEKNIDCILGYKKEDKYIDIYLSDSKIFIEIDDLLHCISPKQVLLNFKTSKPPKDSFYNIRIPNLVLEDHLDEIADAVFEVARMRMLEKKSKF